MKIGFEKFRCFGDPQEANVKKLTILLGENSSGKTSFLAGFRYLVDSVFRGSVAATFNSDPFFLGGFGNISHFRGGKYGRAESFSMFIEYETDGRASAQRKTKPDTVEKGRIRVTLSFSEENGDAVSTCFQIENDSLMVEFGRDTSRPVKFVDKSSGEEVEIAIPRPRAFLDIFTNLRFMEYYIGETSRTQKSGNDQLKKIAKLARVLFRSYEGAISSGRGGSARGVVALAPVRTAPRRSYDPNELAQTAEGDDYLKRLAQASRRSPEDWEKIKAQIEHFGQQTQLFDAINIRKLGRGDADPFQIIVKKRGREANIIDVGYGVSQALPLFVMLNQARRETLLVQQPEVHLHPVAQAGMGSLLVDMVTSKGGPHLLVETHSDYLFNRVLRHLREGKISPDDISVLFFEKDDHNSVIHELDIDNKGNIIDPPAAYRTFFVNEIMDNLGL